jgi:hypothetical protein
MNAIYNNARKLLGSVQSSRHAGAFTGIDCISNIKEPKAHGNRVSAVSGKKN